MIYKNPNKIHINLGLGINNFWLSLVQFIKNNYSNVTSVTAQAYFEHLPLFSKLTKNENKYQNIRNTIYYSFEQL